MIARARELRRGCGVSFASAKAFRALPDHAPSKAVLSGLAPQGSAPIQSSLPPVNGSNWTSTHKGASREQ